MSVHDALALVTELEDVLPGEDKLVTIDPRKADNALQLPGRYVVIVNPPKITQLTTTEARKDWDLTVTAGPADDMVRAWDRLTDPVDALLSLDGVTEATPTVFRTAGGKDYPAYTLTLET